MFLAEHENEVTAGIIVTFYKDTATYYFGASGDSKRNLMAPYLLQWEAILYAKISAADTMTFSASRPKIPARIRGPASPNSRKNLAEPS